jgi:hypothetical protein
LELIIELYIIWLNNYTLMTADGGKPRRLLAAGVAKPAVRLRMMALTEASFKCQEKQAMSHDRTMRAAVVIAAVFATVWVLAPPSGEAASNNERVGNRDVGCAVLDERSQITQLGLSTKEPRSIGDKHFVLEEHQGALRERALAEIVLERVSDPEIMELGRVVRDGHQLGIDRLRSIATTLNIALPCNLSPLEQANLDAIQALPSAELARFFLIRQRVMHAWDITIFTDYANVAANDQLKQYVRETLPPLRRHADLVVRLSNARGIRGGLVAVGD